MAKQHMLFLLFHFEFLIFVANANPPEHFTAPSAKYSTLRKTWSKRGKGVCNICLDLYVATLFLYVIIQKNYIANTKNLNFFPPFPLARKH